MPEDLSNAMSLEAPYPEPAEQAPAEPEPVETADDAEPEGVIVQGNQRLVDVSVLVAERKRVRDATEKRVRDTELTPLQQRAQRADQLQEALNAAQPYVDLVKQNQHLLQQQRQPSAEEQVTDEEAQQEARDLQLYNSQSQLDIPTARKIIARRRVEAYQAAQYAAQQAVAPMQATSAKQASDMNFVRMVQQVDANNQPLVDPEILAQEWVALGPEMTQHPQVAEVVLERAMGRMMRAGKRPQMLSRHPVYSEAPGGPRQPVGQLTALDKKLGLTQADLKASAATFVPGGISPIGE